MVLCPAWGGAALLWGPWLHSNQLHSWQDPVPSLRYGCMNVWHICTAGGLLARWSLHHGCDQGWSFQPLQQLHNSAQGRLAVAAVQRDVGVEYFGGGLACQQPCRSSAVAALHGKYSACPLTLLPCKQPEAPPLLTPMLPLRRCLCWCCRHMLTPASGRRPPWTTGPATLS